MSTAVVPVISLEGVSRRYGGVQALKDVSVQFGAGEIHGLVGENGAGKSTLGKIVGGVVRPDEGRILVDGVEVAYRAPYQALRDGITTMAQELSLVQRRTVIENVMLGTENTRRGVVDRGAMRRRFDQLIDDTGFALAPGAVVADLRLADQQKVEILRCLARGARVIVMDEPTAALTDSEAAGMWETLERLRERGTTIVLVSHDLSDVLQICDTVTVLRNGRKVVDGDAADFTADRLIGAMIGRSLDTSFPAKRPVTTGTLARLRISGLTTRHVDDVSFEVRRGEIVGLAGLVGSGRSEVARGIFGADPLVAGTIELDGETVGISSPRDAIRHGIALIPESRKEAGFVMGRSTRENLVLPHLGQMMRAGTIDRAAETARSAAMLKAVGVRADALGAPVATLSGGNQQKALFAKWLLDGPRVLIADEPTRGVDIPAKIAIYELLVGLADQGLAIVVISSEMEELAGLAHRYVVMGDGRVQGELPGDAAHDDVLRLAFGLAAAVEAPGSLDHQQGAHREH